jgi:hypothetical protein
MSLIVEAGHCPRTQRRHRAVVALALLLGPMATLQLAVVLVIVAVIEAVQTALVAPVLSAGDALEELFGLLVVLGEVRPAREASATHALTKTDITHL